MGKENVHPINSDHGSESGTNAYTTTFAPKESTCHRSPSFNNISQQMFKTFDHQGMFYNSNQNIENSRENLMQNELSFSKTTKTVIDKDLLLNIKKVSELTLQMQETIDQYKNY
jgi:hypothetical protein